MLLLLLMVQIYIYDNTTRLSQEIEVNSTVESVVVYHLAKHAQFTVQMSAFNRAGEGVRSAAVVAGNSCRSSYLPTLLVVHKSVVMGIV